MRCPSCQADNRAHRRFCSACGAGLPAECAGCGFVNEPGEKFCGGCGSALAGAPAARPAPVPRQGERRLVTVLFADLAGYTRLTSQLDPEETQALLARFFETVDGAVLAYGGTIDKHIGDNVMGIFGAPIAHDDDPERAVRAAVDIHRRVEELSAELPVILRVHIGIASGEVVASELGSSHHQEYTVTGDAVNLAARLQDKATAGETMVSDPVRRATEKIAVFEAVGELPIKGLPEPVRVFKVASLRSERVAPRARGFVGRRAELRQLESLLAECVDAGRGAAIQVRGEAGIGKTRFVAEVADRAAGLGFTCHWALVLDFGTGRGQGATRALADGLLGVAAGAGEPARRAAVANAVERGWLAADDAPFLADVVDLAPAESERAIYQAMAVDQRDAGKRRALAAVLRAAAAARPVLLIVEDVHWADGDTLNHIAALAGAAAESAAALLMTSRVQGDPIDAAWRSDTYGGALVAIDLAPLRPEEAVALAAEVYDPSEEMVRTCIERAGGNPLFLEQLLENARESSASGLPATIQSLVLARMDRLPAADKVALQAAAVAGQRFPLELVRALVRDPAYRCTGLVDHHLVRAVGDDWLFHHALIRDGVYSSLTRARRAELHRAAAAWYRELDPVLHARHLDVAEDPGAPAAYAAAARRDALAYRFERAVELIDRGRALARSPADRLVLSTLRGELARLVGDGHQAVAAYTDALAVAPGDLERCRIQIGIAAGQRLLSGYTPAFQALDEAEPPARRLDAAAELAEIHYQRGSLLFACGDEPRSRAEHGRALVEARRAAHAELEARALSGLADADFAAGAMSSARSRFAECLALCDQLGLERFALPNRLMFAEIVYWMGECERAVSLMCDAVTMADRIGDRGAAAFGHLQLGFVLTLAGDYPRARPHAEAALLGYETLGHLRYLAQACAILSEDLLEAGERARAQVLCDRAVELLRQTGMEFAGAMALALQARLSPDREARRRTIAEAEELSVGSMFVNTMYLHRSLIEAGLEAGDWQRTEDSADILQRTVGDEPLLLFSWTARRGQVLAAWGRGHRDPPLATAAREILAQAERMSLPARLPPELVAFANGQPGQKASR